MLLLIFVEHKFEWKCIGRDLRLTDLELRASGCGCSDPVRGRSARARGTGAATGPYMASSVRVHAWNMLHMLTPTARS